MFSEPPLITTININSFNFDELMAFYIELGIGFTKSLNDRNELFYFYKHGPIKYIINPVKNINNSTKNLTICFIVSGLEGYHEILIEIGAKNVEKVKLENGYKIIAKDPDGNFLELYERNV